MEPCRTAPPRRARRGHAAGSQTGGVVQKRPGQPEPRREMRGERLHAHRLGRVVPRVEDVEAQLFGVEERVRSEEHTSELQSRLHLVCRLLLEKKKKILSQIAIVLTQWLFMN